MERENIPLFSSRLLPKPASPASILSESVYDSEISLSLDWNGFDEDLTWEKIGLSYQINQILPAGLLPENLTACDMRNSGGGRWGSSMRITRELEGAS